MVFNVSNNYTKNSAKNQLAMRETTTVSPKETEKLAGKLASNNPEGGFYCLNGDLGAGKTVFVKGFAKSLGIDPKKIKSPTYTYLRSYRVGDKWLHHFDFYRVNHTDDLMAKDLEEIFGQTEAWILIEWPEKIKELLPQKHIDIHFDYISDNKRTIRIENER